MADTSVKISLELGAAAAQVALGDLASKAQEVDKHIQSTGEHGSSAFAEITHHIADASGAYEIFQGNLVANLAIKGIELLTDAAKELFALLVTEGVHAAAEQEDAVNRLNYALAGGGEYSQKASKEFQEFAERLSDTTTVSKTAVLQNGALLESLSQLSGEGLEKATKAAVELAAITGKDLETTTRALARTANGSTTALKKLGITFEEGATSAETFENVLAAISSRGPAAEGATNTYTGALKQNKNALEELQVAFGQTIVQNAAFTSAIQAATNNFKQLLEVAEEAGPGLKLVFANLLIGALQVAETTAATFDGLGRVIYATFEGIKTVVLEGVLILSTSVLGLFAKVVPAIGDFLNLIADNVRDSAAKTANAFTGETGLGKITSAFGDMKAAAQGGLRAIEDGADRAVQPLNGAKKGVEALDHALTEAEKKAKKFVETLLSQADNAAGEYARQSKSLDDALKIDEQRLKLAAGKNVQNKSAEIKAVQALEKDNNEKKNALLDEEYAKEVGQLDDFVGSKDDKLQAELQLEKNYYDKKKDLDTQYILSKEKSDQELADAEAARRKANEQAVKDTLTNLGTLTSSKNRELFELGKQASAANAIINTAEAVTKTFASVPYPLNIPLGIAQGLAGAVQVANIESQQFANGGIVGGSSFSGDQVTARVNSGELILNSSQQATLFQLANGGAGVGGAAALASQVAQMGAAIAQLASQPLIVSIDGAAVFNATRNQIRAGRSLA